MNNKRAGVKQLLGSKLGKKQLGYILLFSSLVTLIGTSIQLAIDYQTDIGLIAQKVDEIKFSYLKSLTSSLWKLDDDQIQIQLNNLTKSKDIVFLEIKENDKTMFQSGLRPISDFLGRKFDMVYEHDGKSSVIGQLAVYGSLDGVYQKLYQRLSIILATQAIKTFLVSFFVLFIVYKLVISHLFQLIHYVNNLDLDNPNSQLILDRYFLFQNKADELDLLVDSFNQMYQKLCRDFADKKTTELEIKASLKEKDTLLQEIHHRVKNNMQVIASLLSLQSSKSRQSVVKRALMDSRDRIYAMASVHETLYRSGNVNEINIEFYLSNLAKALYQSSSDRSKKISLQIKIDKINVGIEQATPLGLVVNELLSNAFTHAFKNKKEGEVKIEARIEKKNQLVLIIQDNGVGMPEDFDWRNSDSLGLQLVKTLVEDQLEGSLALDESPGSAFTIKFPLSKDNQSTTFRNN